MKSTHRFTVPPTHEVGSHAGTCSASAGETLAASALWDYNSARAHEGLPPLSRMPAGTRYERLPAPVYVNRRGQGYLETVDQFDTRKEARAMITEYRMSDPAGSFHLSTRACKGWHDETPAPAFPTNGGTATARPGTRAPLDLSPPGQG